MTCDTLYMSGIQTRISPKEEISLRMSSEQVYQCFQMCRGTARLTHQVLHLSCQRGWIRYVELSFNDAEMFLASLACQKFLPLCANTCWVHRVQLHIRIVSKHSDLSSWISCPHFLWLLLFKHFSGRLLNSCLVCPLATMAVDCYHWCSCYSNNLMPR